MRRIFVIICVFISALSFSQDKVELLNKGNKYFQERDFKKAEEFYKESLELDNQYYKANLNTGHSLFRQAFSLIQKQDTTGLKECLESSELFYKSSLEVTTNKNEKSESLYNLGNAQLLSQNLEESIKSYKKSLRLVPENMNAKHNLALAQYLLNKKQKEEENNQDKEEQNNQVEFTTEDINSDSLNEDDQLSQVEKEESAGDPSAQKGSQKNLFKDKYKIFTNK